MSNVFIPIPEGHELAPGYECKEWPNGAPLPDKLIEKGWSPVPPKGAVIYSSEGVLMAGNPKPPIAPKTKQSEEK